MPTVRFGRKDEPATSFRESDDLIAVRTRSTRSLRAGPVPSAAAAELGPAELVVAFPEAGVEVYRVPDADGATRSAARPLEARKRALRELPDVRFAGGVLVDEKSGEPVVYTENLFVKFEDDAEPDECRAVLHEAGLTIKEELDYAVNAYFAAAPEGTGQKVFDIANALLKRADVEYCHPEVVRERRFRQVYPQQWHLATTLLGGATISASANVQAAHALADGTGITIAVIDDGVDIDHREFRSSGKVVAPRDATLGSDDPRPKDSHPFYPDDHGTACAGVACADGRFGASGVAPRARLMPIRLASGLGSVQEGKAFRWAADNGADVISCSWGPADGNWSNPNDPVHSQVVPLPASTRLAIEYATTSGRAGKGCVVLFAAGNGRESVDNDGYASFERVIAVAACNDRGRRSVYSDFGRAVWCSFPSSDFAWAPFNAPQPLTPGIWTTDRTGTRGYNRGSVQFGDAAGEFTNSFGGTSSACPGVAGVAALVLSANPELRWQEVRDILRRACDQIDPQGGAYDATGRSAFYGYGRVNAERAVQLARPATLDTFTVSRAFNMALPDLQTVTARLEVGQTGTLDALAVQVDLRHTYVGDLVLTLVPPAGSGAGRVVLHNRAGGATRDLRRTFDATTTPALGQLRGRAARGTWTLEIRDAAARDVGTLLRFGLTGTIATGGTVVKKSAAKGAGAPRAGARPAKKAAPRRKRAAVRRAPAKVAASRTKRSK